jgi:hypothetical protein
MTLPAVSSNVERDVRKIQPESDPASGFGLKKTKIRGGHQESKSTAVSWRRGKNQLEWFSWSSHRLGARGTGSE